MRANDLAGEKLQQALSGLDVAPWIPTQINDQTARGKPPEKLRHVRHERGRIIDEEVENAQTTEFHALVLDDIRLDIAEALNGQLGKVRQQLEVSLLRRQQIKVDAKQGKRSGRGHCGHEGGCW
jgi:hypothetical protein